MAAVLKRSFAPAAALVLTAVLSAAAPLWAAPSGATARRNAGYWRGYRMLFVNTAFPADAVLRLAESRGIADVVTETPPPDAAALISSEPQLLPPITDEGSYYSEGSYYNRRKALFFDKSGAYRLFYIPVKHEKAIPSLAAELYARGADVLWDAPAGPAVPAKRWLLVMGALVLFTEAYMMRKIWRRRGWLKYFCAKPYTVPPLVLVILVNAVFSLPQALLLAAAAGLLVRGRLWWEQRQERRLSALGFFAPRPIRPAVLVTLEGSGTKGVLAAAASLCSILAVLAVTAPLPAALTPGRIITATQKGAKNAAKPLSFPAPAGYTDGVLTGNPLDSDSLPDLGHYVLWVYDRMMFPYRSLHDAAPRRKYRDYTVEKGRIVEAAGTEPVLNQDFIDQVLQALDEINGNGIEQVLKKQGGFRAVRWN